MSKEGYSGERKESDSKAVLERLQSYLKDKKNTESLGSTPTYNKPSTSFDFDQGLSSNSGVLANIPPFEDSSNILREVLNHKKAELLRQPEIVEYLKSVSSDLKK